MLGIFLAGLPVARYLAFPPEKLYIQPAPFSWLFFAFGILLILVFIMPLMIKGMSAMGRTGIERPARFPFPWWGWLGLVSVGIFWVLAWSRFSWFVTFQAHTFTPLWLSFILVVNGLCHRQTGRCMLRDRLCFFLLLFPISAAFWWVFEYLNRFVQNWHYMGVTYRPGEYFCYATLSFSTVLPAVLGTRDWLMNASWIKRGFGSFIPFRCSHPRIWAGLTLILSAAGLAGVGVWPDYLFPVLWISPLFIILALQVLQGGDHILLNIGEGDWHPLISSALAALFCGCFWEMWNYYSLAKWAYRIPFVHRFQIFEMPILGYAGYIPFGLACGVIGDILQKMIPDKRSQLPDR